MKRRKGQMRNLVKEKNSKERAIKEHKIRVQ